MPFGYSSTKSNRNQRIKTVDDKAATDDDDDDDDDDPYLLGDTNSVVDEAIDPRKAQWRF